MKHLIRLLSVVILFGGALHAEIITEKVDYTEAGSKLSGTLAYDNTLKGPRPGILVAHEWWGKNDYAVKRAKDLAGLGYVAFALDMFGEATTTMEPKVAMALTKPFYTSRELMRARAAAGLEILKSNKHVDPKKIVLLGYCFGGTVSLELARSGVPVTAVVVFHGGLSTPNEKDNANIKEPVLVLNGEDDPMVKVEERDAFKKSLTEANVPLTFIEYPGAMHAFSNPNVDSFHLDGAKYNKAADEQSWVEMKKFLAEKLK